MKRTSYCLKMCILTLLIKIRHVLSSECVYILQVVFYFNFAYVNGVNVSWCCKTFTCKLLYCEKYNYMYIVGHNNLICLN